MVQFYQRPDLGASIGQGLGQGFADAFGEGLKFKLNKSRFQDAIAPIDEKMKNQGYNNMAEMMMDLVKNVGHLPGGTQMISQMAPALMQHAGALGIGKAFGAGGEVPTGNTMEQPSSAQQQIIEKTPQQVQQVNQPTPGRGATPEQVAMLERGQMPPSQATQQQTGEGVYQPTIQKNMPLGQGYQEALNQAGQQYGIKPNISKYNPMAPEQPPAMLPPLSQQERGNIIQQYGFDQGSAIADQIDLARERQNQFRLKNTQMNDQYKALLQQRTDALSNRAQQELQAKDDTEKDVINNIAQRIGAGYENFEDALPKIRQDVNRFRKIRDDVQRNVSLGAKEIAKSISGGEPLSKEVKRKMSSLRELAKTYKEFGLEDKFLGDMAQGGWPEFMSELTLNPLNKDQMNVLNQIQKSKVERYPPTGQYKQDLRPGAHMKPFQNIPVDTPQIIEQQTNELKPQLWGVLNNPNMKDVSIQVLRQAFMEKDYGWRAFGNALSELLDEGAIDLGQFQKATQADILQPPNEGLDSIIEKGFFNTLRNAIFELK